MAPPPPPPPPPDPAVLRDELIEEFLIRFPPEDPALLARAALVSRQWYHIITSTSFRRRHREFHRSTPPLLGYILNFADSIRFYPMSLFRPRHAQQRCRRVRAVSSAHGRVLLHRLSARDLRPPRVPVDDIDVRLSMCHPVTDVQQDLPAVPLRPTRYPDWANWDAAVVCAVGDGCDHLHCHFEVVFVGQRQNRQHRMFSCFYSSEAGSWSDPVFAAKESEKAFAPENCILIGQCVYTMCVARDEIFKYDLQTNQMCKVSTTPAPARFGRLIAAEDGRLGFAEASNSTLRLWVRENGRWEESRVIDLLLPREAIRETHWVANFAETGAGVIFLWTCVGNFMIDLKSGSCKKVTGLSSGRILPYVSFCTPAPGAGVAISSDEVPVADIAVSTVEGPGTGAVVSADERPRAGSMCQVPKKLKLQVQGPLNQ